ncbi:hypothetical protein [Peptostreptococcus equinus]|uniref:Uncharacterized protein n=1 Tax=Peptostreptococcus equinus TaxID=3003601 RepID=A0ABY7JSN1_9FIRM|nr:hypothetical protein [Peptostreptococcus sp. CBA3647]WAW15464.1 hypothetical protein O0R46_03190 [Peptostreptococcus sp. CBA3647]
MGTTTKNLGLTKDYSTDHYDVGRVNANSDKIDTAIGNYTGSAPDTYSTTIDGDKSLSNYIKFIWAKLKQAISDLANLTKNFDSFKSETQTSLSNKASLSVASRTYNGLMSSTDKTKLDGITISNYYNKGEVDSKLSSKAGLSVASVSANGLMSTTDKSKLDGINISNYYNKSESDNRYALKLVASNVANGLMSAIDKAKLDNIDINNYYNKSEVAQALSLKANNILSSSSVNGLMSSADKAKLDGINIANYYNKTDSDGKYALKTDLDSKASTAIATSGANGLMSATDKAKLDKIDPIAAQLKVVYEDSGYTIHVRYDYAIRYANNGTTRLLNTSTGTGTPINGV